ncbi:MAG: 4-alpha-glucanotransferase, partial [Clostridia bacterium]|nr:4-alpha-glucanotransferase [Clostridia bacterium]
SPVMNLILAGMKSAADTVIIPMQDYLELDENHRMNIPSIENSNWQWRFSKEDLNDNLIKKIKELTKSRN